MPITATLPFLGLALSSALAAGPDPGQEPCCRLYPGASGPLALETPGEVRPSLVDLAHLYAELTGQHLVLGQATEALLSNTPTGLQGPVRVPAEKVQSFFEELLARRSFAVHPSRGAEPRLVHVESLASPRRPGALPRATVVSADEIDHLAAHPATLVTTAVHLSHADARELSTSLRALVAEHHGIQRLAPAGSPRALVVTGFGADVAELTQLLRRLDEESRAPAAPPLVEMVRLKHASAPQTAGLLNSLLDPPLRRAEGATEVTGPRPGPRIVVDVRTNSLLLTGAPEELARLRKLIAELDVEE